MNPIDIKRQQARWMLTALKLAYEALRLEGREVVAEVLAESAQVAREREVTKR